MNANGSLEWAVSLSGGPCLHPPVTTRNRGYFEFRSLPSICMPIVRVPCRSTTQTIESFPSAADARS